MLSTDDWRFPLTKDTLVDICEGSERRRATIIDRDYLYKDDVLKVTVRYANGNRTQYGYLLEREFWLYRTTRQDLILPAGLLDKIADVL